jgi:hypothetical protein
MSDILVYFFEAYFHQDWRDDYASSLDAVRAFNLDEPVESRRELELAFRDLRDRRCLSQDTVNLLGGNFRPETEGVSMDAWLQSVLEIISD